MTLVVHTKTHFIVGLVTGRGPSQDSPEFLPATRQATRNLRFDCLLADAGDDGEHNHRRARRELGIRLTVIKLNPRNAAGKVPTGRYRAQMHRRFPHRRYRQRAQAESVISRHKRVLGTALRSRNDAAQDREMRLRALVHDLMILLFCPAGLPLGLAGPSRQPEDFNRAKMRLIDDHS